MKTVGVIAEFNPFHKGHAYLLEQIKQQRNADHIVIVMSGDFVQRGEPAILDKYARTRSALKSGADLVLELPTVYATASAETFAAGAVSVLAATGVVDEICFGTEYPDFPYEDVAKILKEEPEKYRESLKKALTSGDSFPVARAKALCSVSDLDGNMLSKPNTILGIEYAKAALAYGLTIAPIRRVGNAYHDLSQEGEYLSAGAIRQAILNGTAAGCPGLVAQDQDAIAEYPQEKRFLSADSLSDLLSYQLLSHKACGYTDYADCDEDLSNRMVKLLPEYQSFTQFAELLKVKNYTYTRISRVLLHIVLGIKKADVTISPYLRLLGFRTAASELLSAIKQNASAPMISKNADARSLLSEDAYLLFEKDLFAADLYEQLAGAETRKPEITQSPVRI